MDPNRPIGVFDSGLGGLTVVRALREQLPAEKIVYLGDTARVPYGSKSAQTVERYSSMSARFLLGHDVKLLIIACNTASAYALESLRREVSVPVLGAIEPGAREAVAATRSRRIGVIGTLGTIRSRSYPKAVQSLAPDVDVHTLACPLLVPLVEEGWLGDVGALENQAAQAIVRRYLGELQARTTDADVLVLGCTHYPLLRPLLERTALSLWTKGIRLVDSAGAMARAARALLVEKDLAASERGGLECFVTDEARFEEVGSRFLGRHLEHVEKIDL